MRFLHMNLFLFFLFCKLYCSDLAGCISLWCQTTAICRSGGWMIDNNGSGYDYLSVTCVFTYKSVKHSYFSLFCKLYCCISPWCRNAAICRSWGWMIDNNGSDRNDVSISCIYVSFFHKLYFSDLSKCISQISPWCGNAAICRSGGWISQLAY